MHLSEPEGEKEPKGERGCKDVRVKIKERKGRGEDTPT
jgi:hypothetical protein